MKWKVCEFHPVDVLVAADSRPLGEGGWGFEGDVAPQAFAGALRTLIYKREMAKRPFDLSALKKQIGIEDSEASMHFRFAGPLMKDSGGTLYLQRPLHVWEGRSGACEGLSPLSERRDAEICFSDLPEDLEILTAADPSLEPDEKYVPLDELCDFLGHPDDEAVRKLDTQQSESDFYGRHRRHGHERSPAGVPLNRMLFSRSCLQFKEKKLSRMGDQSGYAGLCQGVDDCDAALVRLGGDGHAARLIVRDLYPTEAQSLELLKSTVSGGLESGATVLLYLATPAVFDSGWRPPVDVEQHGLRLRAAAVGRPRIFGGWNMARGRPKPLRRGVPAGSVYFFEVTDRSKAESFVDTYHFGESVCGLCADPALRDVESKLGYGLALFGIRNPRQKGESTE